MPKHKKQKTHHKQQQPSATNAELTHEEIWDDSALVRSWNDAVKEYEYYHSIHARGEDVEEVLRQAELVEQSQSQAAPAPQPQESNGQPNGTGTTDRSAADIDSDTSADEGEIDDNSNDVGDGCVTASVTANGTAPPLEQTPFPGPTKADLENKNQNPIPPAASRVDIPGRLQSQTHSMQKSDPAVPIDRNLNLKLPSNKPTSTPASTPATGAPVNANAPALSDPAITTDQNLTQTQTQTLENIKMAYYWAGYYSGLYDGQQQR